MKKRVLSLLLCLVFCMTLFPMAALADGDRYLEINEANFPDANFREYVVDYLAGGKDYMTQAEVNVVTAIEVDGWRIKSLVGIERFPQLKTLNCYSNLLATLDLSHNAALEMLECTDNRLTSLNVSNNAALWSLTCGNNRLTTLDVSHNKELTGLDCSRNQLTVLDVSHNTALRSLYCLCNQLTALDVSNNPKLDYLDCNDNQLTALDISHNTELEYLYCEDNRLTTLDVSHNTAMKWLYCSNNRLPMLDLSVNATLTKIEMGQTIPDQTLASVNGTYQYDLSQLVPLANMVKVTVSGAGQLDKAAGKVTFANKVDSFTYQYATGRGDMDVTVNFIEADPIAPPTITTQPKDVNVKNGEQATFTVKATGEGVTYQWFSRPDAKADWALVDGATSDTYTVVGTKDKNGWQFRCGVRNEGGQVSSNEATLTIAEATPPTIETQPKDAFVKSGSKAKFTVKAKEKDVSYQWYEYILIGDAGWTAMAGENKNTLSVVGAVGNNRRAYRCLLKNKAGGEIWSREATLLVTLQPPTIKTQPKDQDVTAGAKAKFTVKASGKNIAYQWYERADANSEWRAIDNARKKTLTVVATGDNNGHQYYCYLKNPDGDASTTEVTLRITVEKPVIKTQPKSVTAKKGAKVKFTVKASGKNLKYQWYREEGELSVPLEGETRNSLTVFAFLEDNGTRYHCSVSNGMASVSSEIVTLTVLPDAPVIKTQPKDAKVKIGGKAKFKVKASPKDVTYQWYYRTSEEDGWKLIEGATEAAYVIEKVWMENFGWQFRCLVKNADGQAYSNPATLRQK